MHIMMQNVWFISNELKFACMSQKGCETENWWHTDKVWHLWKVQKVVTMNIVCFPDYTEWPSLVANMTIPCTWSPWHHRNGGSCGKKNNMPRPIIRSVWQTKIFIFHQRMLTQTHAHENSQISVKLIMTKIQVFS